MISMPWPSNIHLLSSKVTLRPLINRVSELNGTILPDDLDLILNFVTLLIVRGPKQRTLAVEAIEEITHKRLHAIVSSPKAWENAVSHARATGKVISEMPYAAIKSSVDRKMVVPKARIDNNWHIRQMGYLSGPLLSLCAQRSWGVAQVPSGSELIASDSPVSLIPFGGLRACFLWWDLAVPVLY